MGVKAAAFRRYVARKLWRGGVSGWSYPHWNLTKREEAVISYWEKHGHIERDENNMIRLTDIGRVGLSA